MTFFHCIKNTQGVIHVVFFAKKSTYLVKKHNELFFYMVKKINISLSATLKASCKKHLSSCSCKEKICYSFIHNIMPAFINQKRTLQNDRKNDESS